VLLLQLEACAEEVTAHLMNRCRSGTRCSLRSRPPAFRRSRRTRALDPRLPQANRERVIERFAPFSSWRRSPPAFSSRIGELRLGRFLADLALVSLGWLGESIRRSDTRVAALMKKERGYGDADRRTLLEVIGEILAGILPRYRHSR